MKKGYIILLGLFLFTYLNASAQAWEWAKDVRNIKCIRTAADDAGNAYIAGTFIGSCDLPGASLTAVDTALFLAKYNSSGQFQWYKKLDAANIELHAMQVHNGEVYIAGWFTGQMQGDQQSVSAGMADIFIARFNSAGTSTFFMRDGGAGNENLLTMTVYDTHILCGGSYSSTGSLGGNVITTENTSGSFFAKYSPAGTLAWAKSIHAVQGTHWGTIGYLKNDNAGNVFMIGSWEGPTDFGGADSAFYYCQVMIKYNSDGSFNSFLGCSGGYAEWVTGMEIDEQGNIYVAKSVAGNHSHSGNTLTKYSPAGYLVWSRSVGGGWSYGDEGMCLPTGFTMKNGMLYVTGAFQGRITLPSGLLSGDGIYVFKYDQDGNLQMVRNSIGGISYSQVSALDVDNAGNVYIGASVPKGAFGDHDVNSMNEADAYAFAKLNAAQQESPPTIVLEPTAYSQCAGKHVNISATVKNATSVRWYLPGGHGTYGGESQLYFTDPSWMYDSAGIFSAYVVISNSAYSDSIAFTDIINITYPEIPVLSISNGMLVCSTNSPADQYAWYVDGTLVQHISGHSFPLTAEGTYSVRVMFQDGCFAYSEPLHYMPVEVPSGTQTVNVSDLLVVPNPGNGDFTVTLPTELKDKNVELILIDLSGRVVEKHSIECCKGTEQMQAKGIAKGVYLLSVTGDGKAYRQRVVVQ